MRKEFYFHFRSVLHYRYSNFPHMCGYLFGNNKCKFFITFKTTEEVALHCKLTVSFKRNTFGIFSFFLFYTEDREEMVSDMKHVNQ